MNICIRRNGGVFEAESRLWCVLTVFFMIGSLEVDRFQGLLYRRPTLHLRALGIGWRLSEPSQHWGACHGLGNCRMRVSGCL